MKRPLLSLALLLPLGASPAVAQSPVQAELFTRTEGDVVHAALRVEVDDGWHIYHGPTQADLGHPKAIGAPTKVTLEGDGISWSPVRFPEPYEEDQSDIEPGAFILAHHETVVFYGAGRLAEGASAAGLEAKIKGLACELSCIPFSETAKSAGEGPDEVWDLFPDDLAPPAPAPQAEPVPARDQIRSGEADATLHTRVVEGRVQAVIEIAIDPGWHLYHKEKGNPVGIGKPTRLTLKGAGVRWGEVLWPEPHELDQSDIIEGAWIWSHQGTIRLYALGVLDAGATGDHLWGEIAGQTCDDQFCNKYEETFVSRGAGPAALWEGFPLEALEPAPATEGAEDTPPAPPAPEGPPAGDGGGKGTDAPHGAGVVASSSTGGAAPTGGEDQPLGAFLLEAVLWGLVTLLMPCTYPMIPITISFFTKQADQRGGSALPLALFYGAGIVLVFIAIGVVVGQVIVPFAQHPVTNLVITALFLVFALSLFGLFTIQPPRALLNAAGQASSKGGYLGVFLMGTTLVVTSFTCTAPFVGTLLARGAADGSLGRVVIGMGTFGLTMAVPFVFLSLVPGRIRAMPKSGEWMNTLKVSLGFVELAAALKFLSNADLGWNWSVISRELFLGLWSVNFAALAAYLAFKHGATLGRRACAGLVLAFAAYCGWAAAGHETDFIMSSIAPPYSGGRLTPSLYDFGGEWSLVKDDYAAATETALRERKLVFVNFTGFT